MFKTMTGVLDKNKTPKTSDILKIQPFVFCRWLSGSPHTIQAANQLNYYYNVPVEQQYGMIKSAFAGKIKYIPYPKNVSVDSLKSVEYVSKHFKISLEKARDYIELMNETELKGIVDMYTEQELRHGKS